MPPPEPRGMRRRCVARTEVVSISGILACASFGSVMKIAAINKIPGVFSPTVYQFCGFDGQFGMIASTEDERERSLENLILHERLRDDLAARSDAIVRHKYDLNRTAAKW